MKKLAIALIALCTAVGAYAADARVRIYNRSGVDIVRMHTSPAGSPRYGEIDIFGSGVLRDGYSGVVNFDVPDAQNKCVQDVLAVGRDGRRWEWRMNVCEVAEWTLNP